MKIGPVPDLQELPGGCPSFSARVTSVKYTAALKKRSQHVANYTSIPVHSGNELFKHAHKKVKSKLQGTNIKNSKKLCCLKCCFDLAGSLLLEFATTVVLS